MELIKREESSEELRIPEDSCRSQGYLKADDSLLLRVEDSADQKSVAVDEDSERDERTDWSD